MSTRYAAVVIAFALCFTAAVHAQDATRVGLVNPARVFSDMQETKDLKQKLEQDRATLENEVKNRQQKVKDLQAARDLLKSDSPQYAQADADFMKNAIEFDTWSKVTQAQLQGQQKQQMKALFDKIVAAVTTVATARGLDIVIADQRPDLPENLGNITVEQLRAILNSRNVLFNNTKVDISPDVIAELDKNYKAGGGAPPAPAPAGAGAAPAPAPK